MDYWLSYWLHVVLQEMVLAVWLIVKGFNPSAIASLSAEDSDERAFERGIDLPYGGEGGQKPLPKTFPAQLQGNARGIDLTKRIRPIKRRKINERN